MVKRRNVYRVLMGKAEGQRPLGRPRLRSKWIYGRMAGDVKWIHLAQDRDRWRAVVNAVMNLRFLMPRS
jgi:hypothetical protein